MTSASSHPPSASTADLTLISRVRDAMDAHNLNQIDVMRDSGVSNSVLCLWLQSRYKGDNAKVNQRLARWLDNLTTPTTPTTASSSSPSHSQHPHQHTSHQHQPTAVTLPPPTQQQHHTTAPDHIAPIRLDCVLGSQRYQDSFLWNLYEQRLTPRQVITQLCRDVSLSHDFITPLTQQFKTQLRTLRTLLTSPPPLTHPASLNSPNHPLLSLRIDITHEGTRLTDRLLWDPHHSHSSPEEYARVVVGDLGLAAEWVPLIAWSIRDQLVAAAEGKVGTAADGAVEEVPWLPLDDEEEEEEESGAASEREAAKESEESDAAAADAGDGSTRRKRAAVEVSGRKVAVFRVGTESDGWGPELQQVWDKLADMDSSGVSSVSVISAVTEYEKEKEADKLAQRERKRQEKEREQQAAAQQIRQQQLASQPPAVDHFTYR